MFATLLSTGTQSDTSRHYAAIATAAFAGVTAAAAIYAARQVRIAKAALRAQLSRDLWQKWQDLAPARKAAIRYSPRQLAIRYEYLFSTSSGGYYLLRQIPDFFEELAVRERFAGSRSATFERCSAACPSYTGKTGILRSRVSQTRTGGRLSPRQRRFVRIMGTPRTEALTAPNLVWQRFHDSFGRGLAPLDEADAGGVRSGDPHPDAVVPFACRVRPTTDNDARRLKCAAGPLLQRRTEGDRFVPRREPPRVSCFAIVSFATIAPVPSSRT